MKRMMDEPDYNPMAIYDDMILLGEGFFLFRIETKKAE
jgi:hypothetical protein